MIEINFETLDSTAAEALHAFTSGQIYPVFQLGHPETRFFKSYTDNNKSTKAASINSNQALSIKYHQASIIHT